MPNDWTPARRVAFRFGVVYLTLFGLATQISGSLIANPWFAYRGMGRLRPMRDITHWAGATAFGVTVPLDDVSSGETLFFWIQWSWLLVVAGVVAGMWTFLARRRSYDSWLPWCRLAVRLTLAASLLEYGMTKVIPTQFPAPPLTALVTPVGEMTLSVLLWTTIGSAPAYQIITGCVEVLAGVLLILPWTVTLGALLGLLALLQVLLLNLTFDIGVKLVTTHLIVMAVILLAPAARQIAALVGYRSGMDAGAADPTSRPLVTSARAIGGQLLFAAYLLGVLTYINLNFWQVAGGGRPTSVLYGIWKVERLSVNGVVRPPESNDYDRRWRRVIFDAPGELVVQRTDDSFARYGVSFDRERGSMTLSKGGARTWTSRVTFDRADGDRLILEGEMDGQQIEAQLRLMEPAAFPLLNSRFRWIRPHDP